MEKGFIEYKNDKIPFVIKDYCMELFTDNEILLNDFCNNYNFKDNYILKGYCIHGTMQTKTTFLVDYSTGNVCKLRCYINIEYFLEAGFDVIRFESPVLDDVFRYQHVYLDKIRSGINLDLEPQIINKFLFKMNDEEYMFKYQIGHNHKNGLVEDFDKKGEIILELKRKDIYECYELSNVLYRLACFMTSSIDKPFKKIVLYKDNESVGCFCCPFVNDRSFKKYGSTFYNFDVMRYIPRIIDNITLDTGNEISRSVPLGYLTDSESMYKPTRFMEQVIAFEYLYHKLEPKHAKNSKYYLVNELKDMLTEYSNILNLKTDIYKICENIKNLRNKITHGYFYLYDFKNDINKMYLMLVLDELLRCMSLKLIGFSMDEIYAFFPR